MSAENIEWEYASAWGTLQLSINVVKPEKDPAAIAAAAEGSGEGACELCAEIARAQGGAEQSGAGQIGAAQPDAASADGSASTAVPAAAPAAARGPQQVQLGGEAWTLTYSPYGYCTDHCCVTAPEHRPMRINSACFENLLDFLDAYPDYFIGSNADLPIVGGSILAHDHYQGGRHRFPLQDAPITEFFGLPGYPSVRAGMVAWPAAVVRLEGTAKRDVVGAACTILSAWKYYSDALGGIAARSRAGQHNTLTPIAYKAGSAYVMDLVLRNNLTNARFPFGVFHPGEELHHIKKENIGLIEVMGKAILPGRLAAELAAVEEWLVNGGAAAGELDPLVAPHAAWARDVAVRHPELCADNAAAILRDEVGKVYVQVLEACNVFKNETALNSPRGKFLESLEGAAFLH